MKVNQSTIEEIKSWIEAHFNEHIELLKALAAIPAPSGEEDRRVKFITDWLTSHGLPCRTDEAKNVIVPFFTESDREISCYTAHTDVVFPDLEPLPVRIEGGRMLAPGVGDDTANVAAILTMLRYIREHGMKSASPVMFALNSCEEGLGNLKGIRQLMKDHAGRIRQVVSFDCELDAICVKAVGSERWRISVRTEGGHSFASFGNASAIHHSARLISRLYEQPLPPFEGRTTYNVGTVSGGTSVNTIAQSCEMLYEYRSENADSLRFMREQFKALLSEANCEKAAFEAELLGERPCGGKVDEAAFEALVVRCAREIEAVTGELPKLGIGSTDANIPLSLGIPAVTFGLMRGGGAHTREEWLDIESLKEGLEVGLRLVIGAHFE